MCLSPDDEEGKASSMMSFAWFFRSVDFFSGTCLAMSQLLPHAAKILVNSLHYIAGLSPQNRLKATCVSQGCGMPAYTSVCHRQEMMSAGILLCPGCLTNMPNSQSFVNFLSAAVQCLRTVPALHHCLEASLLSSFIVPVCVCVCVASPLCTSLCA